MKKSNKDVDNLHYSRLVILVCGFAGMLVFAFIVWSDLSISFASRVVATIIFLFIAIIVGMSAVLYWLEIKNPSDKD